MSDVPHANAPKPTPATRSRRPAAQLALILIVTVVCCAPKFGNGFVWDDLGMIERGTHIHDPSIVPGLFTHSTLWGAYGDDALHRELKTDTYRPVTMTTFVWDAWLWGRDPFGYHLTNLLGHLVAVAWVFALARRLLSERTRELAVVAAAFFGLHPLLGEAHGWINGRSDVFAGVFGLGAVWMWLSACRSTPRAAVAWSVAAGAVFALGCMSKEIVLTTLPVLALFPALTTGTTRAVPWPRALLATLGPAVGGAVYLGARASALSGLKVVGSQADLWTAVVRTPHMLVDGLRQLLAPSTTVIRYMAEEYDRVGGAELALGAAVCVALAAVALWKRRAAPMLATGLLWYAATLAPAG